MTIYTTTDIVLYDSAMQSTIKVTPDGDGLGMVEAICEDDQVYGKLNFRMDVETTIAFANALLRQAGLAKEVA